MLIPHRTARGPNGIWLIRRGPKHPQVLGFKKRAVFFIGSPGTPVLVLSRHGHADVRILELFDSKRQAAAAISEAPSGSVVAEEVSRAENEQIFDLISQADVLEYGVEQIAVTDIGRRYLEQEGKGEDQERLVGLAQVLPETAS